jgi:glycosyltransferase involved in cell wall biosynthesis
MDILFHLTVPRSPMSLCDAVVQDVESLRRHFGGEISFLYPGSKPGTRFPRRWWGMHQLPWLWIAERHVSFHHIFNPDPFCFDVLRFLRRPIVYTVAAGLHGGARAAVKQLAERVHTLVVSTERDLETLHLLGVDNVVRVHPGIDTSRFSYTPIGLDAAPSLLMGSAPWTFDQFRSKGVDALLELAQRLPELRLVFLWRGVLYDEMNQRVRQRGLTDRVQVLNQRVDVNGILSRVHAAIVLANGDALVKAYPHSLLEALAAGRPVLVSRSIPIAQYVEKTGCGVVVEQMDVAHIRLAFDRLMGHYADYQQRALQLGVSNWTRERAVAMYGQIYKDLLG